MELAWSWRTFHGSACAGSAVACRARVGLEQGGGRASFENGPEEGESPGPFSPTEAGCLLGITGQPDPWSAAALYGRTLLWWNPRQPEAWAMPPHPVSRPHPGLRRFHSSFRDVVASGGFSARPSWLGSPVSTRRAVSWATPTSSLMTNPLMP